MNHRPVIWQFFAATAILSLLGGCQTLQGAGKDIMVFGHAISGDGIVDYNSPTASSYSRGYGYGNQNHYEGIYSSRGTSGTPTYMVQTRKGKGGSKGSIYASAPAAGDDQFASAAPMPETVTPQKVYSMPHELPSGPAPQIPSAPQQMAQAAPPPAAPAPMAAAPAYNADPAYSYQTAAYYPPPTPVYAPTANYASNYAAAPQAAYPDYSAYTAPAANYGYNGGYSGYSGYSQPQAAPAYAAATPYAAAAPAYNPYAGYNGGYYAQPQPMNYYSALPAATGYY